MNQSRPISVAESATVNAQMAQKVNRGTPSTLINSQAAGPLESPAVNGAIPSQPHQVQSSMETLPIIPASSSAMDSSSVRPKPLILTSSSESTDSPQPLPSPSTSSSSSSSSSPTEPDAKAGTLRLHTLKTEANSQASSPSSSRHSTPSLSAEAGVGATRRKDERKVLPRNIDKVLYGDFEIKTWYHSPYPLEDEHPSNGNSQASASTSKAKGKAKARQSGVKADKAIQPDPSPTATRPSTPSAETSSSSSLLTAKPPPQPKVPYLWICEGCFKYMRTHTGWYAHKHSECSHQHPPGRKVYQRGAHTIWEVDGAKQKLYAQNLSLFGKLFIDHKTIFYDVEAFNFYVMTDGSSKFDLALGYFSKEKHSYDNYNLACITTFPPYQKKGYGTLMIEFSYLLSSRAGVLGTPERPLSDLGFKGYVAHWSAVLLRTLALAFDEDHPDVVGRLVEQTPATVAVAASSAVGSSPVKPSRYQKQMVGRIRALLLGVQDPTETQLDTIDTSLLTTDERQELKRLKTSANGWTGEKPPALTAKLATLASSPGKASVQDREGSAAIKTPLKRKEPESDFASSGSERKLSSSPTVSLKRKSPEEDARRSMPPPASAPPASTSTPIRTRPDRAARHVTPTHRSVSPVATFSNGKSTGGKANGVATANGHGKESATKQDPPAPTSTQLQLLSSDSAAPVAFTTNLERISKATGLRPDDAILALSECGLLRTKCQNNGVPEHAVRHASEEEKERPTSSTRTLTPPTTPGPVLLITREAVRAAIVARNVKRPVLELQYAIW